MNTLEPHNVLERNHVTVLGSSGPTLLYAHGFGCNQAMWESITPAFANSHRQVLFDYSGCGPKRGATLDAGRYGHLDGYAQDLLDVCDALELTGDVSFIGHSVSCSIGWLASIARPGLFARMVMVGASPCFLNFPPDYTGGFEREDIADLLEMMAQNYIGWAEHLAPIVAGADQADATAERLALSFCSTDPHAARLFAQATFYADTRPDLARVRVPSLLLQHRHDALAPLSVGHYLHSQLPESVLKVLDVSGHCAHMSHPELVIAALREYLPATGQPASR